MEAQLDYLAQAIKIVLERDLKALDVRQDVEDAYNVELQRRLSKTTWNSGCSSWYLTDEGFNATMFPGFATQYVNQLKSVDLRDYTSTVREKDTAQT